MTDEDYGDLGEEWENDYVRFRNKHLQTNKKEFKICGIIPIPCINKKDNNNTEEERRNSVKTQRLAGYTQAKDIYGNSDFDLHSSKTMFEIYNSNDNPLKNGKKKNNKKNGNKRGRGESHYDMFQRKGGKKITVTEADIDELLTRDFMLNNENDIVVDVKSKKNTAIMLLIDRLGLGNDMLNYFLLLLI